MSQKKINYSKGLIYKLCCKNPEITEIYIGSTTNAKNRKSKHKSACNNSNTKDYNYYVYEFIRDNGGFQNWDMIIIEDFPCNSKNELETRERYWIETLKSKLNKVIPTRTDKEYRDDNKQPNSQFKKKWYKKNKTELLEKAKNYREKNKGIIKCDLCGSIISKLNLSTHKKTMKCKMLSECLFSDED